MNDKALVLLSGGQDSTTCLYWAIARFGRENVSSVTFDYGQRHRVELDCVVKIIDFTDIPNVILPIDTFAALGGNALITADIEVTIQNGMETKIQIHTPLMQLSKKETVELARELGALPAMAMTHSCYNGQRPPCGHCPACELRAKGFAEAGVVDPLLF